jgi:hypothetical protein
MFYPFEAYKSKKSTVTSSTKFTPARSGEQNTTLAKTGGDFVFRRSEPLSGADILGCNLVLLFAFSTNY